MNISKGFSVSPKEKILLKGNRTLSITFFPHEFESIHFPNPEEQSSHKMAALCTKGSWNHKFCSFLKKRRQPLEIEWPERRVSVNGVKVAKSRIALGATRNGAASMHLSPLSSVFSSCLGARLSILTCFGYSRITLFKPCVLAKHHPSVGLSTVRSAIKLFSVHKSRAESLFASDLIPAP